ncbi:class I SAM-dependent methyltransferase [Spinactinospora alkalitolerans]|uniref:class I SAM-dependent methyltransferase n=1 Tax=Spinactinospora alkalitolerans TaxID=687207 RepID=UPI001FE7B347|nr:class I SAM-dependent methyltransferase [Spinactinospora alkalitolerans]
MTRVPDLRGRTAGITSLSPAPLVRAATRILGGHVLVRHGRGRNDGLGRTCPETSAQKVRGLLGPGRRRVWRDGPRLSGTADALRLPFADDVFDAVVATWSLETTADPQGALDECLRVAAPGGVVALAYCTRPTATWLRRLSAPLRLLVTHCFVGRFLPLSLRPSASHRLLHRSRTPAQLAGVLVVRKPPVRQPR